MNKLYIPCTKPIKFSILVIYFITSVTAIGQIKEIRNAPSAEVANLGTYGSIPVGHYTGTPDINIPLYTMNVGNVNIPIQAIYHTSNVKPHMPPSCMGIGWNPLAELKSGSHCKATA